MCNFHHLIMDGLAITTLLEAICDKYDHKNLNGLKPLPLQTQILITVLAPFLHVWATLILFTSPAEKHAVMKFKKPIKGSRRVAISNKIPINQMKKCSKNLGCTINDFVVALLSVSTFEYLEKWNDTNGKISEYSSREHLITQKPDPAK